jgi:cob(I)alamin adenosyltransferase
VVSEPRTAGSARLAFASAVATGRGDDGTTGLLFDDTRVNKDDLRTEAFGTIDEVVSALGLARAELGLKEQLGVLSPGFGRMPELVLRLQRELFVAGAELATAPDARHRQTDGYTRVSAEMMDGLDAVLRESEAAIVMPQEFVVPGETRVSAALELARTVVRRAERRAVTLSQHDPVIAEGHLIPYLNRLADLLWILARMAEQAESKGAMSSRPEGGPRARSRAAAPGRSDS